MGRSLVFNVGIRNRRRCCGRQSFCQTELSNRGPLVQHSVCHPLNHCFTNGSDWKWWPFGNLIFFIPLHVTLPLWCNNEDSSRCHLHTLHCITGWYIKTWGTGPSAHYILHYSNWNPRRRYHYVFHILQSKVTVCFKSICPFLPRSSQHL